MSSFPSITSLEPPPLDSTSEDEDSFEFRTPAGLKLDLQSADPSPLSTPRKSAHKPSSLSSLSLPEENGHSDNTSDSGGGGGNHWDVENVDIEEEEDDFKDCLNINPDNVDNSTEDQSSTTIPPPSSSTDEKNNDIQTEARIGELHPVNDDHPDNNMEKDADGAVISKELQEDDDGSSGIQVSSKVVGDISQKATEDDVQEFSAESRENVDATQKTGDLNEHLSSGEPPCVEKEEEVEEEGFGDFTVFQTSDSATIPTVADGDNDRAAADLSKTSSTTPNVVEDVLEQEDDDDDFGDFSSNNFQQSAATVDSSTLVTTPQQQPVLLDPGGNIENDDDEFEDFANFQQMPSTSSQQQQQQTFIYSSSSTITSPRSSRDYTAALEAKFDTLIKSVIPTLASTMSKEGEEAGTETMEQDKQPPTIDGTTIPCNLTLIENELSETKDCCWGHTVDFEDSRALLHKWPHSFVKQRFYKSLKIDTSTIVYTEKWGAIEVPRCAAGMVEKPILQPQVMCPQQHSSDPPQRKTSSSSTQEDNPVIQNGKAQPLSLEAQRIIQKIPDISYMTSKTLVFPQVAASSSSSSSRSNSLL